MIRGPDLMRQKITIKSKSLHVKVTVTHICCNKFYLEFCQYYFWIWNHQADIFFLSLDNDLNKKFYSPPIRVTAFCLKISPY